jgi:acylpyruvate hydrolase
LKLVNFLVNGVPRLGVHRTDGIVDLREAVKLRLQKEGDAQAQAHAEQQVPSSMVELLSESFGRFTFLKETVDQFGTQCLTQAGPESLLAPVQRPGKVIGVGRNYGEHSKEGAMAKQEEPRLFAKLSSSIIGPNDAIICPASVKKLDWEVEIAVVVGQRIKDMTPEQAMKCIAGYTLLNDVSAREFQFDVTPPQTTFAKSMDTFTPMGPWLVTPDEAGDPKNMDLMCWVNGELMQKGNTSDMIFPIDYTLSYISRFMTLEPGDVLATGTPAGVGHFRSPPIYMKAGDRVRLHSPALGYLENTVK